MSHTLDSYRTEYAALLHDLSRTPDSYRTESVLPEGCRWITHTPTNRKPKPRRYAPSPLRYATRY